ncbi:trypsin-3-like [Asterias amurensis]|uniref:trypsin-3-like n=1 Tax=Asterias amurensis TaxID=7602 RepID=UPI003AB701D9
MYVFLALSVLIQSCLGSLIVGGHESVAHSRPYQVAIMDEYKGQFCGGTLIHAKWVVSAAHCSSGNDQVVYVGLGYHKINKHDGPKQQFIRGYWRVHESWNSGAGHTLDNDIALIELDQRASLNSDVKSIGISFSPPSNNLKLLVSGWGNRNPSTWDPPIELNEVVVFANSFDECSYAYGQITDNMFCANVDGGGKDACQGDSGGPIVSNFAPSSHQDGVLLNGIVSFGFGCATATHPGVYTKISNYCPWIKEHTYDEVSCV